MCVRVCVCVCACSCLKGRQSNTVEEEALCDGKRDSRTEERVERKGCSEEEEKEEGDDDDDDEEEEEEEEEEDDERRSGGGEACRNTVSLSLH